MKTPVLVPLEADGHMWALEGGHKQNFWVCNGKKIPEHLVLVVGLRQLLRGWGEMP